MGLWTSSESDEGRVIKELVKATNKSFTFRLNPNSTMVCGVRQFSLTCCSTAVRRHLEEKKIVSENKVNHKLLASK